MPGSLMSASRENVLTTTKWRTVPHGRRLVALRWKAIDHILSTTVNARRPARYRLEPGDEDVLISEHTEP